MEPESTTKEMWGEKGDPAKVLLTILGWIVGLPLILIGLVGGIGSLVGGPRELVPLWFVLLLGVLIFPPAPSFAQRRFKLRLSTLQRAIGCLVAVALFVAFIPHVPSERVSTAEHDDSTPSAGTQPIEREPSPPWINRDEVLATLAKGWFSVGFDAKDVQIEVGPPGVLNAIVDTGTWPGYFEDTALRMKFDEVLKPLHRLAMRFPQIKTIRVDITVSTGDEHDEFGNRTGEEHPLLASLNIDCSDFRKFAPDIISSRTSLYIANRYLLALRPQFRDRWPVLVREQEQDYFK